MATAAGFRFKDDRRAADRPVRLLHVPNPPHAELTVLTACRVWRFAEEGRHCSKTTAGRWALARDPTLGVVADALHQRHGDPAARIDPAQVAQLLALVRARLAEARDTV